MARPRMGSGGRAAAHTVEYFNRSQHSLPVPFDLAQATFTPGMRVGAGTRAFDTAPIFQGRWDATGTPDVVTFPRGTLLGNQTKQFYSTLEPYQGSISFWITPEWNGNDGIDHRFFTAAGVVWITKTGGGVLGVYRRDASSVTHSVTVDVSGWVAGTTYYVTARWDAKNTLDGTNYMCISVNDVHTFGDPVYGAGGSILTIPHYVGANSTGGGTSPANALIEGLCISRVPFWDGAYGCPMWFNASGRIDVVNAIYAAGAGADPARIFGSWDCTFFLPTDQAEGPLQTTGQAWSHPHGSELVPVAFVDDGGLPGTDYAVEFNGTSTVINCGSGATLDDIPAGGADITVGCWVRVDSSAPTAYRWFVGKGTWTSTGWQLYLSSTGNLTFYVNGATSDAVAALAYASGASRLYDGKWHYVAGYYDDTTKLARVSLDGIWSGTSTVVGAYSSDAAQSLLIGNYGIGNWQLGGIAWVEISDNDRHTAGTNFIPPRYPYIDGNTVECWLMDEGTGATVAASVTSPANDGTITSGTWSGIWAVVGTPEIPQSVQFFRENDGIDFGSGANIDDLPTGDCTIEFWARIPNESHFNETFFSKYSGTDGWRLNGTAVSGEIRCRIFHVGTTADATITVPGGWDNRWHHIALDWDVGTLTLRVFLDGRLHASSTAVGAYNVDNALDCVINASTAIGTADTAFTVGWIRLSNSRRYTGNSFIPNSRNNPPGNDANAQLLINMTDGAGTTATDTSGNGYNGTITFGASTRWNNTPDLAIDEPGKQIYNQGYNFGSDGANDGIYIPFALTADTDYVIRVPLQYSPLAWPRITLYDVTAAGSIVDFDAPPLSAVHDGAGGAAAFTSTGEVYPASLIGGVIYNPTDGSSGTITAVGGTNQDTITAALAGGGSNDWQVGEQAYIVPPTGWVFNEPISAHTSANTAYELRITNRNSDGIITLHQAEVLLNLVLNGSMETGAGAPWTPTSWTLGPGVIAGETVQELVTIHSGASALEWVGGDGSNDYVQSGNTGQAVGAYAMLASWFKMTAGSLSINSFRYNHHNTLGTRIEVIYSGTPWVHVVAVGRVASANPSHLIDVYSNGTDGFNDDAYAIALDDVTLTVTPASAANSLEGIGIRVDGTDTLTWPAANHHMGAISGAVGFQVVPRHAIGASDDFGQGWETLFYLAEDANNYLVLRRRVVGATNLQLEVRQQGAAAVLDNATVVWAVGTQATFVIRNTGARIRVWMDGVMVLELAGLAGFAANFTQPAYLGSNATPWYEADCVIG